MSEEIQPPCPVCGGETQIVTTQHPRFTFQQCIGSCGITLRGADFERLADAMQLREALEASVPWLDRSQLNTIHISRGEGIWFVRASGRVNKHLLKVADECGGPLSSVFKLVAAALIALAGEGSNNAK